jgi:uncharacterized protein YcnI
VQIRRIAGSLALVMATTAAAVALTGGVASAHVEVKADKAQAGATDVTITFSAENESAKASIVSVRVSLPSGILPADVTYVSGPSGWALTPAADGYTVAGPALPAKRDATYAVKVAKLPSDATTLSFKTLVNYSDGRVDRWIDIPQDGVQSDNPAPTLKLAPAAVAPSSAAPSVSAAPTSEPPPSAAATGAPSLAATPSASSGGGSAGVWIAVAVAVLVVLALGAWLWRRRAAR